jgi:hypothetical protein
MSFPHCASEMANSVSSADKSFASRIVDVVVNVVSRACGTSAKTWLKPDMPNVDGKPFGCTTGEDGSNPATGVVLVVPVLSPDVIHWITITLNKISLLQHRRQIQPCSPLSNDKVSKFAALDASVTHAPTNARTAVRRSGWLRLLRTEYSLQSGPRNSIVRYTCRDNQLAFFDDQEREHSHSPQHRRSATNLQQRISCQLRIHRDGQAWRSGRGSSG